MTISPDQLRWVGRNGIAGAIGIKRVRLRKPVFRFSMADILLGTELHITKDETTTCRVADDRKIECNGEVWGRNAVHRIRIAWNAVVDETWSDRSTDPSPLLFGRATP